MANSKIYSRSYRLRKAYWTAFKVIASYFWLSLKGKIVGQAYYNKRIGQLHSKNARRIKEAILKLKGLFIKVGQLLSILSNFVPQAFQEPLEALQDNIAPLPFDEVESTLNAALGQPYQNVFAELNPVPIAAASIGQVHKARLKDGTVLAIKVQHKHIEQVANIDLKIMERLVSLMSRFYRIEGMDYAYSQVENMIREELDFTKEAEAMQVIAENLKNETGIKIPKVYPEFSSSTVLATAFCEGVKINQIEQIKQWQLSPTELGERLLEVYCQMVFVQGYYHADPHPGNILIQKDGTIVFLDFGAIGKLQPSTRRGLLDLIQGAVKNDEEAILKALKQLGFLSESREAEKMAHKMIAAFQNFLQNEVEFEGMNFKDLKVNALDTSLFKLINDIGIKGITNTVQVPKEYVLLNRMITLLLGICNSLDTNINPIQIVRPYFQKFLIGEKGIVEFLTNLVKSSATQLISLPADLSTFLNKANRGQLSFQAAAAEQKSKLTYRLAQQFIFTILLIANFGFNYAFYNNGQQDLLRYGWISAAILAFLYLRNWWLMRQLKH